MKLETARKLFGSKYDIAGKEFQEAMNEVMMFVFADCRRVIDAMSELWTTLQTPQPSRAPSVADEKPIKLMKAVCLEGGVKYEDLPDAYFLRFFSVPHNALQTTAREPRTG